MSGLFKGSKLAACSALIAASVAWGKIIFAGVNESGGEFGVYGAKGQGLPGRFGVDYEFTNNTAVDVFIDQEKVNFFRVTFLMERMVPVEWGLGSRFNETYFSEYEASVNHITVTKGKYALIDPHNYMRYNDPSSQPNSGSVIGNSSDPTAATTLQFAEFWGELARRFVNNPNVVFGINNEPHDMPTQLLLENNQAAIDAIRLVGARQLILAPGNGYTGGHAWTQTTGSANNAPSSEYLNKLVDPLHNTAMDVHEYLDVDFSGGHDTCTQPAPSNLANLTTWLRENNLKAVISEFGAGNNADCFAMVEQMLQYLAANDEYIGWTAWAAGPFWGTSSACCGQDTGSLEPGGINDLGAPDAFYTVWANAIRPNIPTTLKKSGISGLS